MGLIYRTSNLVRGLLNRIVSLVERRHPEALLELEKENLRRLIGQFNQGLASHAGLAERLMAQARKLDREQAQLTTKVSAHLKAGNRHVAGRYALRLEATKEALKENRAQLEQAEATYQNLVRAREAAVSEARAKIEAVRRSLGELKVQRAVAELHEMAGGMISDLGGAGDTLDRLHEMVGEELAEASGRTRVAIEAVDMADLELQESEQAALAEEALAKFVAGTDESRPPAIPYRSEPEAPEITPRDERIATPTDLPPGPPGAKKR